MQIDGVTVPAKQELQYSYKIRGKVADFLKMKNSGNSFGENIVGTNEDGTENIQPIQEIQKQKGITYDNFYLVLFNGSNSTINDVEVQTGNTPFALPNMKITATAKKWEASQVFEFNEDKSRIYEFLKYGYYDPSEN